MIFVFLRTGDSKERQVAMPSSYIHGSSFWFGDAAATAIPMRYIGSWVVGQLKREEELAQMKLLHGFCLFQLRSCYVD